MEPVPPHRVPPRVKDSFNLYSSIELLSRNLGPAPPGPAQVRGSKISFFIQVFIPVTLVSEKIQDSPVFLWSISWPNTSPKELAPEALLITLKGHLIECTAIFETYLGTIEQHLHPPNILKETSHTYILT